MRMARLTIGSPSFADEEMRLRFILSMQTSLLSMADVECEFFADYVESDPEQVYVDFVYGEEPESVENSLSYTIALVSAYVVQLREEPDVEAMGACSFAIDRNHRS